MWTKIYSDRFQIFFSLFSSTSSLHFLGFFFDFFKWRLLYRKFWLAITQPWSGLKTQIESFVKFSYCTFEKQKCCIKERNGNIVKKTGKENLKIMTQVDILTACWWMICNIIIITGCLTKLIHKLKYNDAFLASQVPPFICLIFNLLLSKILRHKMIAKKLLTQFIRLFWMKSEKPAFVILVLFLPFTFTNWFYRWWQKRKSFRIWFSLPPGSRPYNLLAIQEAFSSVCITLTFLSHITLSQVC